MKKLMLAPLAAIGLSIAIAPMTFASDNAPSAPAVASQSSRFTTPRGVCIIGSTRRLAGNVLTTTVNTSCDQSYYMQVTCVARHVSFNIFGIPIFYDQTVNIPLPPNNTVTNTRPSVTGTAVVGAPGTWAVTCTADAVTDDGGTGTGSFTYELTK